MFGPEFFPTPAAVAAKMIAKLSHDPRNFLEPSAGKGDLAEAIAYRYDHHSYGRDKQRIDCIEIQPELTAILRDKGFPVVGYDWLTYNGICYYDAIVMNPPFSNGDEHLLRAWDFLHCGEIVCLLNEETIKNPHTANRRRLATLIRDHGGVDYLGDCFGTQKKGAQRKTAVNVALVYLHKKSDDDRVDLWQTNNPEKPVEACADAQEAMLAVKDTLGNMEHYYNMANEMMVKAFEYTRKASIYLQANGVGGHTQDYEKILGVALSNVNHARAEFGRKHRHDAWVQVFQKLQFHRWLDKKQHEQFLRDIETNSTIPFCAANIKGTLENIFGQRTRLFEQSCANVFDELTRYYNGNTNYKEGWKTNDNFKVNQKLIFPYGCQFDSRFCHTFELRYDGAINIYNDLDRCLSVLDGSRYEECLTVGTALQWKFDKLAGRRTTPGQPREVYRVGNNTTQSTHFEIKFWKKGTVHLKFLDVKLMQEFNRTATKGKRWLGQNTQHPEQQNEARIGRD